MSNVTLMKFEVFYINFPWCFARNLVMHSLFFHLMKEAEGNCIIVCAKRIPKNYKQNIAIFMLTFLSFLRGMQEWYPFFVRETYLKDIFKSCIVNSFYCTWLVWALIKWLCIFLCNMDYASYDHLVKVFVWVR